MPPRPSRSSTVVKIADVARLAGVSPATVSRVINTPDIVAEETVRRVRAAIASTGYVPNMIAGGLASRRTGLVAVIVPGIAGSIFNDTIEAMTGALSEAGFQVMLGLSGYGTADMGAMLDAIMGRRPDGVIMTGFVEVPAIRRRLKNSGVPVIETWELSANPVDMAVGFSHTRIGEDIARHLLALGYRRPALIVTEGRRSQARLEAISAAFAKAGATRLPTRISGLPSTVRDGRAALASLLDGGLDADVLVCSSDWLALGALLEARRRGIRIPEDLGVIGFGNLEFSADLDPPLTTVHVDGEEIGRRCAELLVQRSAGRAPRTRRFDVGAVILERGSLRRV